MKLNKLAIGTAQFGLDYGIYNQTGKVSLLDIDEILNTAKQYSVDLLDTAISYGSSEVALGKVSVDGFRVVTKLPPVPEKEINVASWVQENISMSLLRLRQQKIYGLLLHRSEDLLGANSAQLIKALGDLKKSGLVQRVGVSIYSPDELAIVYSRLKLDLVQAPLNVVDRRLETSGWLDRLKNDKVEIHTRSAFLQGLLLMKRYEIPQKFSRWSNLWNQWHEYQKKSGISALALCLEYPLSLKQVDRVIVGVDSALHLRKIFSSVKQRKLSSETSFMVCSDVNLINPSRWGHF